MNYFYGPVPSRRLGFSLGVDLFPRKICSFDCVYCQLGTGNKKVVARRSYIDRKAFARQLTAIVERKPVIDYITISGSGEPTLHKDLGGIIALIKRITRHRYPVCVITNSFLLSKKSVRKELRGADLIVPSLDAASPRTFCAIDRPFAGISLDKIIRGLIALRREFKGKIWLEIMLVGGINDSLAEARSFAALIEKIRPDKVQLNIPVRPSGVVFKLPAAGRVAAIQRILGPKTEVTGDFSKRRQKDFSGNTEEAIIDFLARRPGGLTDLCASLGMEPVAADKALRALIAKKKIQGTKVRGKIYFTVRS